MSHHQQICKFEFSAQKSHWPSSKLATDNLLQNSYAWKYEQRIEEQTTHTSSKSVIRLEIENTVGVGRNNSNDRDLL
jgi:hypothetical protein